MARDLRVMRWMRGGSVVRSGRGRRGLGDSAGSLGSLGEGRMNLGVMS